MKIPSIRTAIEYLNRLMGDPKHLIQRLPQYRALQKQLAEAKERGDGLETTLQKERDAHQVQLTETEQDLSKRHTESLRELNMLTRNAVQEAQAQEGAAKFALQVARGEIRDLRNGCGIVPFLRVYESLNAKFANSMGIYFDARLAPLYATPGFLTAMQTTEEQLRSLELWPLKPAQMQKRQTLEIVIGQTRHQLNQNPHPIRYKGEKDELEVIGIYNHLTPVEPTLLERLTGIGTNLLAETKAVREALTAIRQGLAYPRPAT